MVQEMLQLHYHIARGDRKYTGRHVGTRLSAANALLRQLVGQPKSREAKPPDADPPTIVVEAAEEVGLHDGEDPD